MRRIQYPIIGRPRKSVRTDLEELVMLTQAALSISNTRRRVLDRVGKSIGVAREENLPAHLDSNLRDSSYEVTVVDQFYQLGQQSFAAHGSRAVWERPVREAKASRTEKRGSHKTVDISLFNADKKKEYRIEFGFFKEEKLETDARKLAELTWFTDPAYPNITNYVILWREEETPTTKIRDWLKVSRAAAAKASTTNRLVSLLLVSSVDLFSEHANTHRVAEVAIFEIRLTGAASAPPIMESDLEASASNGNEPMP